MGCPLVPTLGANSAIDPYGTLSSALLTGEFHSAREVNGAARDDQ